MAIKLDLKQLTALFAQSASNEELPPPIRQFAAQLTVLTAHVERVEARTVALDGHIAELAQIVLATRQAPTTAPTAAPTAEAPAEQHDSEEDEAKAMADKVLLETEAEVAIITAKATTPIEKPRVAITPLRQPNAGNAS